MARPGIALFIDKEGGVNIQDCEAVPGPAASCSTRRIQRTSYLFEVCSPGIERELNRPWHFERCMGKPVTVRLIRRWRACATLPACFRGLKRVPCPSYRMQKPEMCFEKSEAS
jgi:ribosome maturation factor RimP